MDLFISVASKIINSNNQQEIEFVWIGSGYDPQNDFNVSLWIKDQIKRSNIGDRIKIFGPSEYYSELVKRANVFLITSRLDPLPNVAIDAMYARTPTHCFENACGIAHLFKRSFIRKKSCSKIS